VHQASLKVHLDFETYCDLDLKEVGAYKYAEHPSSEILLVGFAIGDNPVKVIEPHDPQINELLQAIRDGALICAHNAPFEKTIWENIGVAKLGWTPIDIKQWRCTAARARSLALPNALADVAIALDLEMLKDKAGAALITKYCKLGKKGRLYLSDNVEDTVAFKNYCQRDVEVEMELDKLLPDLSPYELGVFQHDLLVNDRGIPIDTDVLGKSQIIIAELEQHFEDQSMAIAGFKATQRSKVLEWLKDHGVDLPNLLVETVELTLKRDDIDEQVKQFLELRYESSRVGTKKAKKMFEMVCEDGTIKGSFLYHSATTGRWGSRGVQLQNLGKPETQSMQDTVIETLKTGTSKDMLRAFSRPLSAISKSMRGFIKAPEGSRFLIADYASIEARVLAWLADEQTLLDVYKAKGDVYKTMASKIYDVPVEEVTPPQRRIGKVTILGSGYGMGFKKFHADCVTNQLGISLFEAQNIVELYRANVPNIVSYWEQSNKAVINAIATHKTVSFGKCQFVVENKFLFIILPSGRRLGFYEPRIETNDWNKPQAVFSEFFNGKRFPKTLWGGIITQNISQATARDMLVNGMLNAESNGYEIRMHVHDECIAMLPNNIGSLGDFVDQLTTTPLWAPDFPLAAEGFESERYRK